MSKYRIVAALMFLGAITPALAAAIEGQRPIPMVDGAYQLTPGTWAEYSVRNLPSNTTYRLYIAVLERGTRGKVPGIWLEIGMTSTNDPGVLTRVFAEEGTNGIGRVLQATVQVEDTDPFVVPRRYLGKGDKRGKVGDFRSVTIVTNSVDELMNWKGRDVTVHKLETHDEEGRVTKIIATRDVPPLGIVLVRSLRLEMDLEDWGDGATTRLTGKPIGLYRWLWRQMLHPKPPSKSRL